LIQADVVQYATMSKILSALKVIIVITLLGFVQCLYAQNNDFVSLEEASETIRKESKGQVLSATTNQYNGVTSHRIQVLTKSGRVKVYQVPAYKKDIPQHYGNSNSSNKNNYRNRQPNNSTNNNRNRKPNNSNNNRNNKPKPSTRSNSRSNSRSNYNRSVPATKQPSYSSGDTKKK